MRASSAENTPVEAMSFRILLGSLASRTWRNLVLDSGFEDAGNDISLAKAPLGGGGAEAGVGGEAGVGVDLKDIGLALTINPEIDASIAGEAEEIPGGGGEARQFVEERGFVGRKDAGGRLISVAVGVPFLRIADDFGDAVVVGEEDL